ADSSRRERFARDPQGTLADFAGTPAPKDQPKISDPKVLWRGLGAQVDVSEAGKSVGNWVLSGPGRLSLLLNNPASAIDAALAGRSSKLKASLVAAIAKKTTASKKTSARRIAARKRTPNKKTPRKAVRQ